jgi:UDP-N-acetylglucosamine--N-acetylmuramyl-(pentapeptide) pyrophosphoryl-undecaprenol N-acetylglucosamine transferase
MSGRIRLLVAGGVTGGHLFPGIAFADALRERVPNAEVRFLSTGRPLEVRALFRAGYPLETVAFGGVKGLGARGALRSGGRFPVAVARAWRIARDFRPHLVLGVGGYASVPGVLAGRLSGALTLLHEQNVQPGMATRLLAPLAHRIYTAFEPTPGLPPGRTRPMGNPVRAAIRNAAGSPLPEGPFTLLVVGGSQGARGINRAVIAIYPALARAGVRIFHQTGPADFAEAEVAFEAAGVSGEVRPFFGDMARRYRACHLLVCRSGASTAAEIAVVGRGAILVPFPHAADDHQTANARILAESGAGMLVPEATLDGPGLARRVLDLADDPERVAEMARAARRLGRPDAAPQMVEDGLGLLTRRAPRTSRCSGSDIPASRRAVSFSSDSGPVRNR